MADWISLTLAALGATETSTNRAALAEWAQSEGMPASANNPLAATDPLPGSTAINSKGVQAYASIGDAATLYARKFGTLTYDAIGFALKTGNDLNEIFTAINQSPWCRGCQGGRYPVIMWEQLHGTAPAPPSQTAPVQAPMVNLPQNSLTRSWAQLMRTLAVDAPRQLREAKTARARIRRAVR